MSDPRELSAASAAAKEAERRAIARATAVLKSKSESFSALVRAAGYNPRNDLRYSNWSGIEFKLERLHDYDFTACRLHNCSFAGAYIAGARFDGAKLDRVVDEKARLVAARAAGKPYVHPLHLRAASDWEGHLDEWRRAPTGLVSDDHLAVGDIFQDAPFAPELVVLPHGVFTMGSPLTEHGRERSETQRQVTIGYRIAVGRFAVTFAEWQYARRRGWVDYRPGDEGWGRGMRPVINVTWEDAQAYAAALSRETGHAYRLLSDSEWEFACRAGSKETYCWGPTISPEHANYSYEEEHEGMRNFKDRTCPVDEPTLMPNAFGLWQMHGNVWEWCADVYELETQSLSDDGSAHIDWANSRGRVVRGGSWRDTPERLRSASRHWSPADLRSARIGFRLARPLAV